MKPSTVSLFCGGGGESVGKHLAFEELGINVLDMAAHAINHWDLAVATHGLNLPWVKVYREDITQVTARDFGLEHIELLWASPSCVHHSRARGGKPREEQQRSHAWEVVDRWLRVAKVDVLMVENVSEFMDWGPLDDAGQIIKARKGESFRAFVADLRALGYVVEWRVLCAADYGDPTTRRRFFLQAVRDGRPIVWPEPTHRDPRKPGNAHLPPWRSAAECIDWSLPCKSIFERKRPLADATMRRIAAGVVKFVLQGKPFLVTCNHRDDSFRGQGIDEPMTTVTAAHDARGVVVPQVAPFVAGLAHDPRTDRNRSPEDPLTTIHAGGNNHAVAEAKLTPFVANLSYTGTTGRASYVYDPKDPLRTITGGHNGHAVVAPKLAPFVANLRGTEPSHLTNGASSPTDPIKTVSAGGRHQVLVSPCLVQTSYGERQGQAPRVLDLERPLGTVVAGGQKHSLVAAFMAKHYGGPNAMEKQPPGLHPSSPMGTVTAQDKHGLVAAHVTKFQQNSTGQHPDEPLHTVMAGASRFGAIEASLSQQPEQGPDRCKLVAAFLHHYYSHGTTSQRVDLPIHTITTIERHGLVTVEIDGESYVITDIGLRMLEPRELAKAMGFPAWYRWEKADGSPLSKRDAVKLIGNACPVNTVKELIKAVVLQRPGAFDNKRAA